MQNRKPGRPRKENRIRVDFWMDDELKIVAEAVAARLGYRHGDKGKIGGLVEAIASGELEVRRRVGE